MDFPTDLAGWIAALITGLGLSFQRLRTSKKAEDPPTELPLPPVPSEESDEDPGTTTVDRVSDGLMLKLYRRYMENEKKREEWQKEQSQLMFDVIDRQRAHANSLRSLIASAEEQRKYHQEQSRKLDKLQEQSPGLYHQTRRRKD